MRIAFLLAGFVTTGLGFAGIVLPGLPATPFFLLAAYFFARSNKKLEQWILNLPKVGHSIRDFREGKGIPLKAKIAATIIMVLSVSLSLLAIENILVQAVVIIAVLIGLWVIYFKVPTKHG